MDCLCLNRPLVNRFGSEEYAAYIKSWVRILKEDKRAIFKASALASKACDFLREKAEPH